MVLVLSYVLLLFFFILTATISIDLSALSPGQNAGAVYIFERDLNSDTFSESGALFSPADSDSVLWNFGWSVAVNEAVRHLVLSYCCFF